jgi:hypothetical protein
VIEEYAVTTSLLTALEAWMAVLVDVPRDPYRIPLDTYNANVPLTEPTSVPDSTTMLVAALNFRTPAQTVILSVALKSTEAVCKKSSMPSYLMRRGAPMSA